MKLTFLDGRGHFNIAGYHNKVTDAQRSPVLAPNGVSQTVIENADTETWGVEADVSISVVAVSLNIYSGAMTHPQYTHNGGKYLDGTTPHPTIVTAETKN